MPDAVEKMSHALDLGMTPGYMQMLAKELWGRPELVERLDAHPLTASAGAPLDIDALRRALFQCDMSRVPAEDGLRMEVEKLLGELDQFAAAGEELDALLAARVPGLRTTFGNTGRAGAWGGSGLIDAARTCAKEVVQELNDSLAALRSRALARVMPYVVEFVRAEAVHRGQEGALVFDDLILRTRDILRDDSEARLRVRMRYDAVLIDEFQDTDPLQVDIARAFAGEPASGREPGRAVPGGRPEAVDLPLPSRRHGDLRSDRAGAEPRRVALRAAELQPSLAAGRDRMGQRHLRQADRRWADTAKCSRSTASSPRHATVALRGPGGGGVRRLARAACT